ncbi:MAG: hypothetical protein IPO65_06285 [Saprospiraceae bacterium]|nr:hypothetical protein [Saprospiraceae bacterium]
MVINKHLFAFLIVLTVLAEVKSQLNVKVGYNAQYTEYKETNKLFASFNKNTTDLNQPFEAFHFMHGLELGARMMISNRTAIDGGFTSLFTTDNASARNISGTITNDEWRISQRVWAIGLEKYYRIFGFGVQLGNVKTNYLRDYPGAKSKLSVYSESYYNVRFCLILQAKTRRNAFALKPYYNYPLSSIDIGAIDKALNNSSGTAINERLSSYGISIVFYNGPQR